MVLQKPESVPASSFLSFFLHIFAQTLYNRAEEAKKCLKICSIFRVRALVKKLQHFICFMLDALRFYLWL